MKTLTDYIKFFEAIPEEKWCTGDFKDFQGRHCAIGHLGMRSGDSFTNPIKPVKTLAKLLKEDRYPQKLVSANNGYTYCNYHTLGKTPKERTLNYLYLANAGMLKWKHLLLTLTHWLLNYLKI